MSTNVFSLGSAKELPSGAFHAVIKLNGKRIGEVSNEGRGGPDFFEFKDRGSRELFTIAAKEFVGDDEPDLMAEERFVTRLFLVNRLNSVRTGVIFVDSPDDYWENGRYGVIRQSGVAKDQIIRAVKAQTPDRIVWNTDTQEFVPAHAL